LPSFSILTSVFEQKPLIAQREVILKGMETLAEKDSEPISESLQSCKKKKDMHPVTLLNATESSSKNIFHVD